MWDLPGPGIEPVSSALAGGFLTTAPPGKSLPFLICMRYPILQTAYIQSAQHTESYIDRNIEAGICST